MFRLVYFLDYTTGKYHSFVSFFFKFIGTNEYIQIIFVDFETDEYNYIHRFGPSTDKYMGRLV
jgi:hypothetical protein